MITFSNIDKSIIDFWSKHKITEKDLYCRKCNSLMIDFDEASNVKIISPGKHQYFCCKDNPKKLYVESPQNRWCIKGRELSGKTYFRHLCWDCLKKEMTYAIEHNDELNMISPSRFKKWKRMLINGRIQQYFDKFPPPPWNSPIWWFKLIFDITDEELDIERRKFDTASIDSFVRRYGEDEGQRRYDDYVKLQANAGCSLEYFIEKYGEEAGKKKYEAVCKNKGVSKKNCIEKYGKDVGEKFFKQYCSQQSYAGVSLSYFVDKFGEIEGNKKYSEVCKKKMSFKMYSNISQKMFKSIDSILGNYANNSRWEEKNHEFELFLHLDNTDKLCRVDYFLNGKIIEFNGDVWHANPKKYKANDVVTMPDSSKAVAKDIWLRDENRLDAIKKQGFKVFVVWESDYASDPERMVDECVKFLKDE